MTLPLRRLIMGLLVAAVGLLLLEGVAQLALLWRPDLDQVTPLDPGGKLYAELEFHPQLLWRLRPGERNEGGVDVRVNELRMRGAPPVDRGARVLFVGDSSVFGWGVDESEAFPWVAVDQLPDRPGPPPQTVNAATPGYSSSQARLQLERLIPELEPEVVVIATLWSDLMRTDWSDRELFARFGSPEQAAALSAHDLRTRSALYSLLRAALLSRRPVPRDRRVLWGTIFEGDPDGSQRRVPPADHRANLERMNRTARAHGAKVVYLVLPTHTGTRMRPPDREIAPYHDNFEEVGQRWGAPVVDANDSFSQVDGAQLDALFIDPVHPSARGHARIAHALAPVLADALAETADGS